MTNLLLKLFIKDHQNPHLPAVRTAVGKMSGIVGILCNLFLFAGKMALGILASSVSITADALNNLSDAASSIVTLLGFQLAKRPADRQHPYGHGRYEYLAGLAVSVLILFIGYELMKSSISKILQPAISTYTWATIIILAVSILMKLWMSLFFRKLGNYINSTTLFASSIDCRNDVIATGAVLAGCALEYLFSIQLDGYIGLIVSLFIIYSGLRSAKETASPLLGSQADKDLIERLSKLILSHDKIIGIHDLLIHDYGPGQRYASVHAELSAQYDPIMCHEIIDHIENEVLDSMNIQLVIHFDPVSVDDNERVTIQQTITAMVDQIHPHLSVHDLRIDRRSHPHTICFDLAIPYDLEIDPEDIRKQIKESIRHKWMQYRVHIQVDRT